MISSRVVALDALRAGVPGRDSSGRIEHEDRVVLDALDEQPEQRVGHGGRTAPGIEPTGQFVFDQDATIDLALQRRSMVPKGRGLGCGGAIIAVCHEVR